MGSNSIYGKQTEPEYLVEKLKKTNLAKASLKIIVELDDIHRDMNLSANRRLKVIRQTALIAMQIQQKQGKSLEQIKKDREPMQKFMRDIYENPNLRPYTKKDYYRMIVQLYRRHPDFESGILEEHSANGKKYTRFRFMGKLETKSEKESIITEIEIKEVLKRCPNIRNRAFIALLHETGMRASEILNILLKDIVQKDRLMIIKVDGKTGIREVPVLSSKPYLVDYLNNMVHLKHDDYIWQKQGNFHCHTRQAIGYAGANKVIDEAFERAKLSHKKHNLHYFRHFRATINAEFMTDAQMCKFFGWVIGSGQAATYVNGSTLDIEKTLLKRHGYVDKETTSTPMTPKTCPVCGFEENIANYCQKCSSPLTLEVAMSQDKILKDQMNASIQELLKIAKDPELMAKFEKFKTEENKNHYNAERKGSSLAEDIKSEKNIDVDVIKPNAFILIGNSEQLDSKNKRKDFRILRTSLKNVQLYLYDELLVRIKNQQNKIYID